MNILIFTLQERQAPIMSDAARRKERELAQKEVSTMRKLHLQALKILRHPRGRRFSVLFCFTLALSYLRKVLL